MKAALAIVGVILTAIIIAPFALIAVAYWFKYVFIFITGMP